MTTKKWPSIDEQLAEHKIPTGSALAQIVRDNQDFHMLRPEEAHDDLGLPPWFRVLSRKLYPDFRHLPGDPSGYPKPLRRMLHMMLHDPNNPAWITMSGRGGKP
jgi:hypothetical protein